MPTTPKMENDSEREQELIETLQECWTSEGNSSISSVWLKESLFGMHDQYTDEEIGDMFGTGAIEEFRVSIAGMDKYN